MADDADSEAGPLPIFFSIVRKSYSRVRVVPVPPAAAHKMAPDDIGVAVHEVTDPSAANGDPSVVMRPSSITKGGVRVLSRLGDVVENLPGKCDSFCVDRTYK